MKKHFAKQIFAAALAISFVCGLSACREREEEQLTLKPVIYLYPEEKTDISVTLAYDGTLTCTYPNYKTGWHVSAKPDGTLTDEDGQTYNYLYWEGTDSAEYDLSHGFCVANEFIVYWLPQMQENPYNLIAFQSDCYTQVAQLDISPAPDTLLRVFMAWKPLEEKVDIPAQTLTAPARDGFTAVEWGGSRIN